MTPHRLIASDSDDEGHGREHAPSVADRQPFEAERDEDERERRRVVAEPVAELDPALREVHEVDERDEADREDRARSRAGSVRSAAGPGSRGGRPGWSGSRSSRCRAGRPAGTRHRTGRARRWGRCRPGSGGRRCSREDGRGEVRRPEQRDPEVLRQVARILRSPVGVIAEARIARRSRGGTDGRTLDGRPARSSRRCRAPGCQTGIAAPRPADQARRRQRRPARRRRRTGHRR